MLTRVLPLAIFAVSLYSQTTPGGTKEAAWNAGYQAQAAGNLTAARTAFQSALQLDPDHAQGRLDYAYLLLRIGETHAGRDQLQQVLQHQPQREDLWLELAFLRYETSERAKAFEIFNRLRLTAKDPKIREQASSTFLRLEENLKVSIARWREAVAQQPQSYSAHEELARWLEEYNDWVGAAAEYRLAYGYKPEKRSYLLDIARTEREALRDDYAFAALLAASRGPQAHVAEAARELLPERYPYPYEFRYAIAMDPLNVPLRREYGFLLLAMKQKPDARQVFEDLLRLAPDDALSLAQLAFLKMARKDVEGAKPLLARAAQQGESGLTAIRELATSSLEKGFLKDAVRYLQQLNEASPDDYATMLRLGWTHNMLKQDKEAVKWFGLARHSPDPKISAEAEQAYKNLRPSLATVRITSWALPFYSTRWHEGFAYGQAKIDFRLPIRGFRPYLSSRWIGDLGRSDLRRETPSGVFLPQALSERAMVAAGGVASDRWKGLMAWGEAGIAWQYFGKQQHTATFKPDYRAGVNYAKNFGAAGLGKEGGWFTASTFDAVFLSRFQNDTLFYSQNRIGHHPDGWPLLLYWNLNLTVDARRLDWANYWETGPGLRFRLPGLPTGLYLFADLLEGHGLNPNAEARFKRYKDVRIGAWYAFTH